MSVDSIAGLTVTRLREIPDERGAVLHMLRADDPSFDAFGECYFSEILPGVVKAWKRHRVQWQNLAVPVGRIRLVVYDSREGSASRGKIAEMEMGRPDAYIRVSIPPGVWYGFQCLSEGPALIANCPNVPHSPEESERRPDDDPGVPFSWSGRSTPL